MEDPESLAKYQDIIDELDIGLSATDIDNQKTLISLYSELKESFAEIDKERKELKKERAGLMLSLKALKSAISQNPNNSILICYLDQTEEKISIIDRALNEKKLAYYTRKQMYEAYEFSKIPELSTFMSSVVLDRFGLKQLNLFPSGHKAYALKDQISKGKPISDEDAYYICALDKWCSEFGYFLRKYIYEPISKNPSAYGVESIANFQHYRGKNNPWWYKINFISGLTLEIRTDFPFTSHIRYNLPIYDPECEAPYNLVISQDTYDSNTRCLCRANEELHNLFNLLFEPASINSGPSSNFYFKRGNFGEFDFGNVTILNDIDPLEITYIKKLEHSRYYDSSENHPYNFAQYLSKLFMIDFENIIPNYLELHVNFFFPSKRKQKMFHSVIASYAACNSEYISILKGSTIYFEFPNRPKAYVYDKTLELYQRRGIQIPWFVERFELKLESKDISRLSDTKRKDAQIIRYLNPLLSGYPCFSLEHRRKLFKSFLAEVFETYYPLSGITEFIRSLSDKSTPYLDQKLPKLKNKTMREILNEISDFKEVDSIMLNFGYSEYQYKKYVKKLVRLKLIRYNRSLKCWVLTPLGTLCLDCHVPLYSFFYSLNSVETTPNLDPSNEGPIVSNTCIHKEPLDPFTLLKNLVFESLESYREASDG